MSTTIAIIRQRISKEMEEKQKRKREREAEKERLREQEKRALEAEMAEYEQKIARHQPVSFTTALAEINIQSSYMTLLENKQYANRKLETLKDVKVATKIESVLYTLLELFLGIFVIYSLLYRVMGPDYFSEVTMTFGLDIDPLYIALAFEAIVIVMFSLAMKLYITARFDESKKAIVRKWMRYSFIAFVSAYVTFIYMSNL